MRGHLQRIILIGALSSLPSISEAGAVDLRIGMAKSFFVSRPKVFTEIVGDSFAEAVKKTTGLTGKLDTALGPFELGQELNDRKIDFAILHGHEFASVRKQFPELQPLLLVANKHGERAYLIVNRDSNAKSVADLAGKKVDVAVDVRGHCRAFLARIVTEHRQEGSNFLGPSKSSGSQVEALNELAAGKTDAALVDSIGLATYKDLRGPVFMKHLKILVESEDFPASVIVYQRGALDEKVINQFRDGLTKAQTTDVGRQLMKDWHIDSFDRIPDDYEKLLNEIAKAYPLATP